MLSPFILPKAPAGAVPSAAPHRRTASSSAQRRSSWCQANASSALIAVQVDTAVIPGFLITGLQCTTSAASVHVTFVSLSSARLCHSTTSSAVISTLSLVVLAFLSWLLLSFQLRDKSPVAELASCAARSEDQGSSCASNCASRCVFSSLWSKLTSLMNL